MSQLSPNAIQPNQPFGRQTGQPFRPATTRGARRWLLLGPIALMLIGGGLVLYPFIPAIKYSLKKPQPSIPYQTKLSTKDTQNPVLKALPSLPTVENKPTPKDNRIVIPSINVDMSILEGPDEKTLNRGGIWHIPKTSDPAKGGNFVVSGHRWQYLPPSSTTLYLLDKVKNGEPVIVYWHGTEYDYHIVRRDVVDPSRVDILNPTPKPQLTIFTCTPVFSTKQRLVLFGELIS